MKKRCLTILIAATMCCTMACPAVAAEYDPAEEVQLNSVTEEMPEADPEETEDDPVVFDAELLPEETQEQTEPEQEEELSEEESDLTESESDSPYDALEKEDITEPPEDDSDEYGITLLAATNGFDLGPDGAWYYYTNGEIDTSKNSVIQDKDKKIDGTASWWYVVGGKVQTGFTGLADYSNANGWWYIENGKVTFSKETVARNRNGWFYVKDSKVQFNYNGFANNSNGWWYIENGKVTFSKNSVIQDVNKKIDGKSTWWYVVGSKVQSSFTGLADYSNSSGWWYIEEGKVTFNYEGVEKNKNGWFYVKDSKVQFGYNGFAHNGSGWWYIENGKVTFNKNSVIQDKNNKIDGKSTWWYVVGSKVQTSFTGLADYSNANGWWYIENGKVTFTKDTIAKNKNGWFYVKDSKVDFSFTGLADFPNENGWWYIRNGKVDFSVNTVAENKNGWWYIEGGKVNFNYSGNTTASGKTYAVEGGKVTGFAAPVVTVTRGASSTTVNWNSVGAEKYCVFRKVYGGSWTKLADTSSTSYTDNTQVRGTNYYYMVRCVSAYGSTYTSSYISSYTGSEIVNYAEQFLGNPYVWDGLSLTNGCDCSGFVAGVYGHFGVSMPHYSFKQAEAGYAVSYANAKPGDIIFYNTSGPTGGHIGIYIGNGQMISAKSQADGICIHNVDSSASGFVVRRIF